MPLKTLVKVGNITNLSDARYCAGMGVEMLGFGVIEGQKNHISSKLFQEIRGWVSGPKVVAEMYGLKGTENPESIIHNYAPDYLELSLEEYKSLPTTISLPLLVSLRREDLQEIGRMHRNVSYWIVDEEVLSLLPSSSFTSSVLLRVNSSESLQENLARYPVKGVALNGSQEIRPGYKNYDELADVLEALEEY